MSNFILVLQCSTIYHPNNFNILIPEEDLFYNPNAESEGDDLSSKGHSDGIFSGDSDNDSHSDNDDEDDEFQNARQNEHHYSTSNTSSYNNLLDKNKDPYVSLNIRKRHLPICSEYRSLGGPTSKCTHCNAQKHQCSLCAVVKVKLSFLR